MMGRSRYPQARGWFRILDDKVCWATTQEHPQQIRACELPQMVVVRGEEADVPTGVDVGRLSLCVAFVHDIGRKMRSE